MSKTIVKRSVFITTILYLGNLLQRSWRRRHPRSLQGKVVIITGASAGIGWAAARLFAAEGSRVVLVARREKVLVEVQQELSTYPADILTIAADVSQDTEMDTLVKKVQNTFGRVDILVNNAGLAYSGFLQDMNPERLRHMVDVNLYGPIRLTQLILPTLLRQGSGHIINVSSMAGQMAAPGMAAYAATRRGLSTFSDALRRELAGTGVRVSLVLPGWTRTEMTRAVNEPAMRASRGMLHFEKFAEPGKPAMAILNAALYNQPLKAMGGLQLRIAYLIDKVAPWFLDVWMRHVMSVPQWVESLSLGAR